MKKKIMGFYELFYIFLFGCLFGYMIELLWSLYRRGIIINHTALVVGPFNIVYGFAAVFFVVFLYKYRNDNIIKLFVIVFIVGSLLEYLLSFSMEKLVGFVAWNYKKYFLNINGRICLKYSILWGILGVIWIRYICPVVIDFIRGFNRKKGEIIKNIIIVFLVFDSILTLQAINRAKDYEKGITPSNKYEELLDRFFGMDYLNNMFNYRWNKK